jgi:chromosome segregation protein
VLVDWLTGCYTAPTLDEALAKRADLQAGETIYVPTGHAVTAHSVTFYAQDSEQSGCWRGRRKSSTWKRKSAPRR